jgi:hypothetical protein
MQAPKRYVEYTSGASCSVKGCPHPAEYEVYLYDYYPPPFNKEFFEQDFTCPFLCSSHMEENEALAEGARVPRGMVYYPYTNRHKAQGYTTYAPIKSLYEPVYEEPPGLVVPRVCLEVLEANEELIRYLARHPETLYELNPRKFEEIVADIFRDKGFGVTLTPRTRDGGRDIHAVHKDSVGSLLYLIECKRYSSSKKVGVELIRALYGVKQRERATMGILATTSSFTTVALDFATPLKYELSLRDYTSMQAWLKEYGALP